MFGWRAGLCALLLSCGPTAPTAAKPAGPTAPTATVTPVPDQPTKVGVALTVTPKDADVSIDDVSYGRASALDPVVELKPGLHTLMVAHDGYAAFRVEFSVTDKTESFVVRLEPLKR